MVLAPMSKGAPSLVPHALLLLMIAVWGGSYVASKAALDSLAPFAVIVLRFWLALLCLLPFTLRPGSWSELRAALVPGLWTGSALAVGYLLQTVGMGETSASMGGFLAGLIPLLVALGGWLVFHAKLGRLGMFGLGLGLCGMILLAWPSDAGDGPRDSLRGVLLQIGSSTSYAAHILLLSRFGRQLAPTAFCSVQLLVVAIAATVALAIDGRVGSSGDPQWTSALLLQVGYLAFFATALGIAVQSIVQPKIAPMHVALLFATQPLFAALAGWSMLGDAMGAMQLVGGATIVVGIVVTAFDR